MKTPEEKYRNDPQYNRLVHVFESLLHQAQFTPSEIREAAMFACIIYERNRTSPAWIIPARKSAELERDNEALTRTATALNDEIKLQAAKIKGRDETIGSKDKLIERMRTTLENVANKINSLDNHWYLLDELREIESALAAEKSEG